MVDIQGATLKSFTTYLAERTASTTGVSMAAGLNTAGSAVVASSVPFVNAADFGVMGDGGDYTTELNAAMTAAFADQTALKLPPGTIVYSGNGADTSCPNIIGDSSQGTVVSLAAGKYLIDANQGFGTVRLENITFSGGAGAIRNRYTSSNVAGKRIIRACKFTGYTKAAIEANAVDDPYWTIEDNVFIGANYTTSIGIALAGWADADSFTRNDFQVNKIHIKIGRGGQNCYLKENAFLRLAGGTARIDVWVVPAIQADYQTSGQGFVMRDCKFGNENLDTSDYKVLYADEGSGTYFGDRLPVFTASTGVITGHTIRDCATFGNGSGSNFARGFVYSTTPNLRGCRIGEIGLFGTPSRYLVEFSSAPVADLYNQNNVFGPVYMGERQSTRDNLFSMTNGVGVARIVDPTSVSDMVTHNEEMPYLNRGGPGLAAFVNLYTGQYGGGGATGTCTKAADTDVYGGNDCVELTFTAGTGAIDKTFDNTPVVGVPIWIDFDLEDGDGAALSQIRLSVYDVTAAAYVYDDWIQVPATVRKIRRKFVPRSIPAGNFKVVVRNVDSEAGTVKIGMLRAYQAREPVSGGAGLFPIFLAESQIVPATPTAGYVLYVQGGALKGKGTGGTVTTIGPA